VWWTETASGFGEDGSVTKMVQLEQLSPKHPSESQRVNGPRQTSLDHLTTPQRFSIVPCMLEEHQNQQHTRIEERHEGLHRAALSDLRLVPPQATEFLKFFARAVAAVQAGLAQRFGELLGAMSGAFFDSAEESKRVAKLIQDTANRLQVRLCCPNCSGHGTLQFEAGSFRMNHRSTTHSLGTHFPEIRVTLRQNEATLADVPIE
jgi:hypothetical protein